MMTTGAVFVGTMILLHSSLKSGDVHPVCVNPWLVDVVSVKVKDVMVPQPDGDREN